MGQQQILIRTEVSESNKYSTELIKQCHKKELWEDYRLGSNYCEEDIEHAYMMLWILNSTNSELKEFFDNFINDIKDTNCECVVKDDCSYCSKTDDIYQLWLNSGNSGTREDFLSVITA